MILKSSSRRLLDHLRQALAVAMFAAIITSAIALCITA